MSEPTQKRRPVWLTGLRVLTFTASEEELCNLDRRHLAYGLFWTWIVGMGRWWDDPGAHLLQHLGLGSLIYVFVLSLLLWGTTWLLLPKRWSYLHLLTFITLTSPPALLYAIPVERFWPMETARFANIWFLSTVALWRVSLFVFYLQRFARLAWHTSIVGTLLPVCLVVATLTFLNLERAVFQVMGGFREPTLKEYTYGFLVRLTLISAVSVLPLMVWYVCEIAAAYRYAPSESAEPEPRPEERFFSNERAADTHDDDR